MQLVLVVDDEPGIRSFIRQVLEGEGLEVEEASDGQQAAERIDRRSYHLMITDLRMPGMGGMELLERARASLPEMEVIVLTAHGTVETAVQAMKLGAFDYLTKPLSGPPELRLTAQRALERHRLRRRAAQSGPGPGAPEPIAVAPAMRAVLEQLDKVASTAATVLLLGESGTGKEVAARALHHRSPRGEAPFVAVNCAAVSPQLIESEMFGHEKGAFTGASDRRVGRFELADGGTLFLDEVAELPAELQAKLLRVLQERSFERLGGNRTISVDVRLVAATNRDLEREMREGRFREDLYHRLAVFPIRLPPLRERPEDIVPLARHILERLGSDLGRPALGLSPEAERRLLRHDWPGNVRELGNALERAAILAPGNRVEEEHLLLDGSAGSSGSPAPGPDAVWEGTLKDVEREAIRRALEATGHHRKRAAERLGIGLRTLYDKLKAYGLD
jgi:two-component system response regulator FlrC